MSGPTASRLMRHLPHMIVHRLRGIMRKTSLMFSGLLSLVALSPSLVPIPAKAQSTAADDIRKAIMRDYEIAANQAIQSFRADKWPTDFEMQNYCYESQVDARKSQAYDFMGGRQELMIIWANCTRKWKDDQDRIDWEMQYHCTEGQLAALDKIKRRRK